MKKLNRILLVDDDDVTNIYNQILIRKLGVADNVDVATNGRKALDYLRERSFTNGETFPELVLLDINMPEMNGFEFLEEYGKMPDASHNELPIVMLTSSDHDMDLERAQSFPYLSGYYVKPLREENIRKIFEDLFH